MWSRLAVACFSRNTALFAAMTVYCHKWQYTVKEKDFLPLMARVLLSLIGDGGPEPCVDTQLGGTSRLHCNHEVNKRDLSVRAKKRLRRKFQIRPG